MAMLACSQMQCIATFRVYGNDFVECVERDLQACTAANMLEE
jgi:hypothetical protein